MNLGKKGFILNGGGLAGCSGPGFVKALAKKGIKPDYVQGVSVGALILAILMSNGWNIEEVVKLWLKIQKLGPSSIFNRWNISINVPLFRPSIFNEKNIFDMIIKNIDCRAIVESPIKYDIIANNRNKKKIVAFSNHDAPTKENPDRIKKILQAAIGFYGFLPSVLINGDWYCDAMGFSLNEAIKARCDTIFILMSDQFGGNQKNYGGMSFLHHFVSGFHDLTMRRNEEHIKYARSRGYDIIENNPSGRFEDANPLHKKFRRKIKHIVDSAVEAVTANSDVEDVFCPHRIVILTPPNPIPTLHLLGFKGADPKIAYPGDISLNIEQCSNLPDEFWEKLE